MKHAHLEFLSHEDFDRDVERVYRAYCDATLLKFAADAADAADGNEAARYWTDVVNFRRDNFGPVDRSEFVERTRGKVEDVPPAEQRQAWDAEGPKYAGRLEFLYWFDVRADFWSTVDKSRLDQEFVVTSDQLKMLYGEILAAKRRLQEAEGGDGNWSCRNRNHEILASLPSSPPKSSGAAKKARNAAKKPRNAAKKRGTSSPQSPPPSSTPSDESS